MPKLIPLVLILTSCSEHPPMKVMTYNVKHGELSSLGEIADFINEEAPTIVALQELDNLTDRSDHTAQNEWLGTHTGMQAFYFQADHDFGHGIGFLVDNSVKVTNSYAIMLTTALDTNPRIMAVIEVVIDGQSYLLINVHLSYVQSDREVEMGELSSYISRLSDFNVMLFGDFNQIDRSTIPLVECGPHATYPSSNPQVAIDAVMVSGLACTDSYVVDNGLSDHAALVAIVE